MKKMRRKLLVATLLVSATALNLTQARAQGMPGAGVKPAAAGGPQKIIKEGVEVEFTIGPTTRGAGAAELTAGQSALVRFRVRDAATGAPLSGVGPSAWASLRGASTAPNAAQCREKVQSYLQGSLRARADVDFNTYHLLVLNQEPNISVIDPLLGFGGSKLVTFVILKSPGEDWALTADRSKLFVSMPLAGAVAVVDTRTWKVVGEVGAGARPTRVALQPDGKYLWVVNEGEGGEGGVTAIDAASHQVAAVLKTGAAAHEVAFSEDNKFAYVGNRADGTLSVIDIQRLAKLKDVKTGAPVSALAYSPLSKSLYVANEADGSITVVDGRRHEVVARIAAEPGVKAVRFAPGGRWGFAPNAARSVVHIFDASTNRMAHSVAVGKSPDQVAFTDAFAYVRSLGTEAVSAIRLSTVGKEPDVVKFPGGQNAPGAATAHASRADALVPAPEGGSVLIANPADRMIYYYSEGMAAPMGDFRNYKHEARAVKVVDRSLREESPGVYATEVLLPKEGVYDISFLLDSPRVVHCFEAAAGPDPNAKPEPKTAVGVEYLNKGQTLRVGENFKIRFKLTDAATGRPKDGLKDVRVLFFLAPGVWQKRDFAAPVGGGVYELEVEVPRDGVYMVFVESQSQGVSFRQLPYLTLQTGAK
jgi:DNA-binding beta-propeller fold protein YncE